MGRQKTEIINNGMKEQSQKLKLPDFKTFLRLHYSRYHGISKRDYRSQKWIPQTYNQPNVHAYTPPI